MSGGLSDEEIAELKRRRRRKLLRQAAGGAVWGVFFSVAPIIEILFVCAPAWIGILVWREVVRSRRYGFWPGAGVRLAVVGGIVALAAWLPFKYEDRLVKPLSKAEYTLGELSEAGPGIRIYYPPGMDNQVVRVPREPVSIRKFIRSIEIQTGLRARIGHCGNGATLLWGACPMGGVQLKKEHPDRREPQ
jgi:hypothetical protein